MLYLLWLRDYDEDKIMILSHPVDVNRDTILHLMQDVYPEITFEPDKSKAGVAGGGWIVIPGQFMAAASRLDLMVQHLEDHDFKLEKPMTLVLSPRGAP
jgi:hypothetical protein